MPCERLLLNMKQSDFIFEILGTQEKSLAVQVTEQYESQDLANFLTFLMGEKDRRIDPQYLSLRAKLDQVGHAAVMSSPNAAARFKIVQKVMDDDAGAQQYVQRTAVGRDPLLMEMLAFYAESCLEQAQTEQAKRLMRFSIWAAEGTKDPLTLAISQYQFGMVLLKLNELTAAVDLFEKSLPSFEAHYPRFTPSITSLLAFTCFNMGAMSRARPYFLKLVAGGEVKNRGTIYRHLAEIEYWLGNLSSAENYANQAEANLSQGADDFPMLWMIRARIERRMGNYDNAEIAVSKALAEYEKRGNGTGRAEALNLQALIRGSEGRRQEISPLLLQAQSALGASENATKVSTLINQGMEALQRDDDVAAESAFRTALDLATRLQDDFGRALCLGNLGATFLKAPREDPTPYLLQALRLFTQLNSHTERIEVLYNLGYREAMLGVGLQRQGLPEAVLSPLRRAREYFEQGIQSAEEFGQGELLVQGYVKLAAVYSLLDWQEEALQTCIQAADRIEHIRLALIQDEAGATFVDEFEGLYAKAVWLAYALGRPALALWLSERLRSRHLVKNLARTELAATVPANDSRQLIEQEHVKLEQLHALYGQLQQTHQANEILAIKEKILPLETEIESLYTQWSQIPELREYIAIRRGQPLQFSELLLLLPGYDPSQPVAPIEPVKPTSEHFVFEGGARVICPNCQNDNFIGSTFCSICDARLPRSASVTLDAQDESDTKRADADALYNRGLKMLFKAKIQRAAKLFEQGIQLADHPDYHYFLGWCYLGLQQVAQATGEFKKIETLKFQYRYPFYPLPISPQDLHSAIRSLQQDSSPENGQHVLRFLIEKYNEFYADR